MSQNGKGKIPEKGRDLQKFRENWDEIFKKHDKEKESTQDLSNVGRDSVQQVAVG